MSKKKSRKTTGGRKATDGQSKSQANASADSMGQGMGQGARWFGVAAPAALLTAGVMTPGESSAEHGSHLLWVMGWIGLLLVAAAFCVLRRVQGKTLWRPSDWACMIGFVWMAVAALAGAGLANARPAINMMWHWIGAAACFWALRQTRARQAARHELSLLLVCIGISLALHGMFQYAVTMPALVREYDSASESERAKMLREMGIDPAERSPSRIQFENRLKDSTEPYATFALANSLAGVLTPAIVLVMGLLLAPQLQKVDAAFLLVLLAVLGGCLMLTKSRTGVGAAGVGLMGLVAADLRGPRRLGWKLPWGAAGAAVLALAGGVVSGVLDREVFTQATLSLSYRLEYWRSTLAMIADRPLLGCGAGSFQDYYGQYRLPHASELVADPHNFVLELAATGGVVAALLLTGVWCWQVFRGVATNARTAPVGDEDTTPLRTALVGGVLFGLFVGSVGALAMGFSLEMAGPAPVFWLTTVVALAAVWRLSKLLQSEAVREAWVAAAPIALFAALVNLLAAGGIGYWGLFQWIVLLGVVSAEPTRECRWSSAALAGAALALAVLALALQQTGLGPVLNQQRWLDVAQSAASHTQATEALEHAKRSDRWSPAAWQLEAQLRAESGRRDEATWQQFAEALDRDPRNHRLREELAKNQLAGSDFGADAPLAAKAIENYQRVAALVPRGPAWAKLAWAMHCRDQKTAEQGAAKQGAAEQGAAEQGAGQSAVGQSRAGRDDSVQGAKYWARRAMKWDADHPHEEQRLSHVQLPSSNGRISADVACRTILGETP